MQPAASGAIMFAPKGSNRLDADATKRAGRLLFLLACAALGTAELVLSKPLPQLHLVPPGAHLLLLMLGGSLLALAPLSCVRGWTMVAASGLAASWLVALLFALRAAFARHFDLLVWVPASKDALFALAALAVGTSGDQRQNSALAAALQLCFGLAMIFYASVHLLHRNVIADLIPAWIPARQAWPWVTGSVLGLCGVAIIEGRLARSASFILASMFGSWIMLLHVERAAQDLTSIFEWAFALSALALLGIALVVAAEAPKRNRRFLDVER